jgi:ribosomal protein L37E
MILTLLFAIALVLLSALFLGLGRLLKSKNPLECRRCGSPEKKNCSLCIPKKLQKLEFCQNQRSRLDSIEAAPIQLSKKGAEGTKDRDSVFS